MGEFNIEFLFMLVIFVTQNDITVISFNFFLLYTLQKSYN